MPKQAYQFKLFQTLPGIDHWISTRHSESTQPVAHGLQQVHGHAFHWLDNTPTNIKPAADALLTNQAYQLVRVGVSDCVPILVYSPTQKQVGVVHAGMKGTSQEILRNVLGEFNPRHTYIGIGPAIGACCYYDIDLQIENVSQARLAGVPIRNIEVLRYCTKCRVDTFYSHRAGDNTNFGLYAQLC